MMKLNHDSLVRIATALLLVSVLARAGAEENAASTPAAPRTTGLPGEEYWTFNLDAGYGAFGFDNSLYTNKKPDSPGNLSDNWQEGYIKPAISLDYPLGAGALISKLSVVGERTFSAPPPLVGGEAESYGPEDAYIGWRSGDALGLGKDALEITVGRIPYKIGHGFLIWDGAGDGGSRGGFWSGARKDWKLGALAKLQTDHNVLETFFLERDDLPEQETHTRLSGANYELHLGSKEAETIFGLTYIKTTSSVADRDGMSVYDGRLFTTLPFFPNLSFEAEAAHEENGSLMASDGWTAQLAYKFARLPGAPQLSYRYTFFKGDSPGTHKNEAFDPLFPGFYDWGTWWQGEIAGEYFLSNSNLESQQIRLHFAPNDAFDGGIIGYAFRNDQPATFGTNVTSHDIAAEVDGYVDWKINHNFTASFVLAYADPRAALEQGFQRTEKLTYGMAYLAYSF
jgi:hypothetical protein